MIFKKKLKYLFLHKLYVLTHQSTKMAFFGYPMYMPYTTGRAHVVTFGGPVLAGPLVPLVIQGDNVKVDTTKPDMIISKVKSFIQRYKDDDTLMSIKTDFVLEGKLCEIMDMIDMLKTQGNMTSNAGFNKLKSLCDEYLYPAFERFKTKLSANGITL